MSFGRARCCWLGWALSLLLWLRPGSATALQQVARALPEGLIVLTWAGDPSLSRVVDASQPVALDVGEVLLVPIEAGDRVRVVAEQGPRPLLGLATGLDALPDVITWDPSLPRELRLPAWSSARFVAARVTAPAELSVEVAARSETPLAWHEWDRWVASSLRGKAGAPALPEGSAAARAWRGLEALLASLPSGERPAAADLLEVVWLEQALRVRPLVGPYFRRQPRLEFEAPRELQAGERYELDSPGIDVVRWLIRASGSARVVLREGEAVSRELSWSAPPGAPAFASRARSIRVVPPAGSGHISLEVLEGKISFEQRAWVQRAEFGELLGDPIRTRTRLLERAHQSALGWVRSVAAARARRELGSESLLSVASVATPGDLQAWLLLEAALTERHSEAAVVLAERAAAAARSPLLAVLALQQRRDVLPPAAALLAQPSFTPSAPGPALPRAAAGEEELWLLALRGREGLLAGTRPSAGARLEQWAALRSEDREVWASVAGFWRSIPYRSVLPSPGALISTEYVPLEPGVDCPLPGAPPSSLVLAEKFERWLLPSVGSVELVAELPPQHFTPLLFKPLSTEPVPESSVRLDELEVPLHAAAGLSSEVALSAGRHSLQVPADALPFAVRLSTGVMAPCEQLRRTRTWTELGEAARADFELPAVGAMSVARLTLAPAGPAQAAQATQQELEVQVGARRLEVWGRGARSGASEIRVEAQDAALSLRGRGAAGRVRIELRRAADAPNPTETPPPVPAPPAPAASASATTANPEPTSDLDAALSSLRELGRSLRTARGEAALTDLRARRARLLEALGFKELALRDADPEPVSERGWAWLPGEQQRVIPTSLTAKIGPLSLPASPAGLAERRQRAKLAGCASFAAETEPNLELGADAETLLLAYCAEQNGLVPFAARAYEAIGRNRSNGAALARAATLLADHALDTAAPALALRARILAALAGALGEDTSGLLARLAPALEWVVPNAYERSAGFATVTLSAPPNPTLGTRVRRALVDAPDAAMLVDGDRSVRIGVQVQQKQAIELELGCEDPADLACQPELRRDGERFECPRERAARGRCSVPLAPGEHQLDLRWPSERALGWVKATLAGQPVPIRLSSRWIEVESEEPAQLTVRGPTVVLLEARGSGGAAQTIAWEGCGDEPIRSFELPGGVDPGARVGSGGSLGNALRVDLPIETEGPCLLRVGPTAGRALFRLSVARATGLPRARVASYVAPEALPPPPPPAPFADTLVARELELGPLARNPLPLLLLGHSQAVVNTRSLEDDTEGPQTPSTSHLQLDVLASRELIPARAWTSAQVGVRLRNGPPSLLGRLELALPATSGTPGVELDTAGYWQSIDGLPAFSLRTSGRLSALAELTPNLNLIPRAGYTLSYEPPRPDNLRVTDNDVYSAYRATHSHYLSVELEAAWRPMVDALGKLEFLGRALPAFDGIDRAGVAASWLCMPLAGTNALLELELATSLRPQGPGRAYSFARQTAGFGMSWWRWISDGERMRLFGRIDAGFDAGSEPGGEPLLTAGMGVEFSTSGERGLRDLSPSRLPFIDLQERGRGGSSEPSNEERSQ